MASNFFSSSFFFFKRIFSFKLSRLWENYSSSRLFLGITNSLSSLCCFNSGAFDFSFPKLLFALNSLGSSSCLGVLYLTSNFGVLDRLRGCKVSNLFYAFLGVLYLPLLLTFETDLSFTTVGFVVNFLKKSSLFFLESSIIFTNPILLLQFLFSWSLFPFFVKGWLHTYSWMIFLSASFSSIKVKSLFETSLSSYVIGTEMLTWSSWPNYNRGRDRFTEKCWGEVPYLLTFLRWRLSAVEMLTSPEVFF